MSTSPRALRAAARAASAAVSGAVAAAPASSRVAAIDAFRGLTLAVMIFVNDLGSEGIPQWMRHMPADANAMSFVDVVFPAFLFVAGMSIPVAAQRREALGAGRLGLWAHMALRTFGLLVLGVFMVNQESFGSAGPLSYEHWSLLFYLAVVLVWNSPARPMRIGRRGEWALRALGVGILVWLAALYRGQDGGAMQHHWWGILGLIGWSYAICAVLYELAGRERTALAVGVPLLACASLGMRAGLELPAGLDWLGDQSGHAVHAGLTLTGLVVSLFVFGPTALPAPRQRLRWIAATAALLALAGFFLRPLHGVSKIYATPSWGLYSAAWCCAIFGALYWLLDVRGIRRWARFVEPAASNSLLVYILPSAVLIGLDALGISFLDDHLGSGIPRMLRAAALSLAILALAHPIQRWNLRLRL